MGKHCGYTEHEDGSIVAAPMYADRMMAINIDIAALENTQKVMMEHFVEMRKKVEMLQSDFWRELTEDYSLDTNKFRYSFDWNTRKLTRKAKPIDPPPDLEGIE